MGTVPKKDTGLQSVLIFGGTTEGRELAEWLSAHGGFDVVVSSLTEYGGSLVEGLPRVRSLTGRMLPERMVGVMEEGSFSFVIDATHPYAAGVSASIAASAQACGLPLYRVLREGEPVGPWESAASAEDAAHIVAQAQGRVLLTTGSKDLPIYAQAIDDFAERVYVRILPVASSLEAASNLGIPTSHVIAMQGPFSKELNVALLREFDISMLVTKASGKAGGFWEKVEAAQECGARLVVINRPVDEKGLSVDELKRIIDKM